MTQHEIVEWCERGDAFIEVAVRVCIILACLKYLIW